MSILSLTTFLPNLQKKKARICCSVLFFFLAMGLPAPQLIAHGSLHEAIAQKTRQIQEDPDNALLRFERGLLYQQHEEKGRAIDDFNQVLRMEPGYYTCHLPLAQLYRDTEALQPALYHINTFLEREPENPFGYETRASIYQMSGSGKKAVADLRKMVALKNDNAIRPDDYFLLADGILSAYPGRYALATEALELGVQRLGPVISLQERLLGLEIEARRYPDALRRIEQIMKPLPRKEKWQARKAEVIQLMEKQQRGEARAISATLNDAPNEPGEPSFASASADPTGAPPLSSLVQAEVIRGPYLQSGTPTSMVIKWRTSTATNSVVWYGPNPANLNQTTQQSGSRTDHEITLSGLQPNTTTYYAIGDNGGVLAGGTSKYFFETSPPPGSVQPVRAWVLGDCGTANSNARDVRDGYYSYVGSNYTDLILLLGDNAYDDGTDAEYQDAIFRNMYEDKLIQSVIWSTPGNHDYHSASASSQTGPYYDIFTFPKNGEAGGLPSGTEAYYAFDYANIHFVVLDSHDSGRDPGDPMLIWLENDLNATQQEWIITFFHHPPYSKGSHDSDEESHLIDMRENVLPILEAAGVDLVLSGHSHSYERSYLLNGHYGPSGSLLPNMILDNGDGRLDGSGAYQKYETGTNAGKGAVYTCAGSSGKVSDGPLDHPVMYYSAGTLGSLSLEVMDQQLDLKFIGVNGEVLDYFTIRKFTPVGNPPAVQITLPADEAFYPSLAPITLSAQASDSDGYIEAVTFYINGDSVGIAHVAPYTVSWVPPAEGSYHLLARATDNDGNSITATEHLFHVGHIRDCSQVNSRENDAEEGPNGGMSLSSSDLELINDPNDGDQWVGMRFTGLNIPPGATVSKAWIQFAVEDNNNDNPCHLYIYGEASNAPAPFSGSDYNISSRPLTQASVSWQPDNWEQIGEMDPLQQTPNLAPILQELITRNGYSATDAIVLIIQGEGRRTAESFDGQQLYAPQLCVEYLFCTPFPLAVSSSTNEACPGEMVTLSAGPADSYLWSTGATSAQITVQPTETTTYQLTAWNETGCPTTKEITVTVLPEPLIALESDSVSFCPGQGASITAPAGFADYEWSNGQNTPSVLIDSPGNWSLTVTDANGCSASTTLYAVEAPALNLQASSSAAEICSGQAVTLNASPASSYLWSTGATTAQIMVQPSETATYSLTAWNDSGCSETAEITVTVLPEPQVTLESDTVFVCQGQGVSVTAPAGFANYEWSNGQNTPSVLIDSPGNWSLTVTDANGCSATAALYAVDTPPLNLQVSSSTAEICSGQAVSFNASPASSYLWSTGATTAQIMVHPTETTTYSLTAWNDSGCSETAEIEITVYPLPEFEIEEQNGQLAATGLEGQQGFSFSWSNGADTPEILPDSSGQYCVIVTSAEGCVAERCYKFLASGTSGSLTPSLWEVFPNPFKDEVRIRPSQPADNPAIAVFGLLGQPVPFRLQKEERETILKFSNLPSGYYFIAISNGKASRIVKMLKL